MKAGISTLVLSNPKEGGASTWNVLPRVLEDLASIGYKSLEINTRSLPRSITEKNDPERRHWERRIPQLLDSLELEVHQVHISNNPGDIGSQDPATRQIAVDWIENSMAFCQVFNPRYVGIHPGGNAENLLDPGDWPAVKENILDSTRHLARFARNRGSRLLLETTRFDARDLKQILQAVSDEDVGILVDTGHCICYLRQDPAQVIREFGGRLWSLHIHDNHGAMDEHLIPGEGVIEWKGVLKALRDIGYRGVFMMECYNSHSTRGSKNIAQLAKMAAERLLGEAN